MFLKIQIINIRNITFLLIEIDHFIILSLK